MMNDKNFNVLVKKNVQKDSLLTMIKMRQAKTSLKNLTSRENELKEYLSNLREYIEQTEHDSNNGVINVLEKNEKYKNVLSMMIKKHAKDLKEAEDELNSKWNEINDDLNMYENRMEAINKELNLTKKLLKVLATYKNQEYPEKLLKIKSLKKQMNDLVATNTDESDEFKKVIQMERSRLLNTSYNNEKTAVTTILETEIEKKLGISLQNISLSNKQLKEEIDVYIKVEKHLKEEIETLKNQTQNLLKGDKWNFKKTVYPEFYQKQTRCTPDMDIVIDYKMRRWNNIV